MQSLIFVCCYIIPLLLASWLKIHLNQAGYSGVTEGIMKRPL